MISPAYLAGYTDAEALIGLYRSVRTWKPVVRFHQADPTVITRIREAYNGSGSFHGGKPSKTKSRPTYVLAFQSVGDIRRFLTDVLPYLKEKRPQAAALLDRFVSAGDNGQLALDLQRMKEATISPEEITGLRDRLQIAPADSSRRCTTCGAKSFARGFCAKHYQKAKREGLVRSRARLEGVSFAYHREPTDIEKAYIAGYFDGDGCLSVTKAKYSYGLKAAYCQTQPDALLLMHEIYGGSLKYVPPRKQAKKPALRFQLCGRNAILAFLRDIRPHVIEKQNQVELALNTYEPKMSESVASHLRASLSAMKKAVR